MAELLAAAAQIPIAQLAPDLSAPSTRYIRAIVTLIWPYSSSNLTLTVLLADPDFRLRRTRGQVRVQFSGSSARAVFEAGIGSGDEVILSLDGVEWTKDDSAGRTPGRSIDWELRFSERLVLKIQQNESDKISLLDIDHPAPRSQPEAVQDIPEPEPLPSPPKSTTSKTGRPELIRSETSEWSSPAFVKRARVSYGSLLESGYNLFAEEDGTVQGKGRKRARFSRKSGAWRYSSRSQSPEPSQADEDMVYSGFLESDEEPKPVMTDEGCQTLGLEDDSAAEALADLSKQEGAAVNDSFLLQGKPALDEVSAPNLIEDLNRSEASVDMRYPPISHVDFQDGNQEDGAEQQAPSRNLETIWGSAHIDPAQSDVIALVPLPERSDPITDQNAYPDATIEVEDLYGLSPTADGYPRSPNREVSVSKTASHHDASFLTLNNDHYEALHPLSDNQTTTAYPKLPSRSTSPEKYFESTSQAYPELDVAVSHDFAARSGPYYGEESHNYPNVNGDHLNQLSRSQWDMHTEDVRSPNTISLAEHEISHDIPMRKLLARHFSPGGIAMSRSHSAHSEMIDLTEESDDEGERLPDGSLTSDEEETNEQFYRKEEVETQSGGEEEGYENLLYDKDVSESGDDEADYDDEENIRHPPGFQSIKHLAPGEVEDDDEDEDEVEDYDEDEGGEFEEVDTDDEGPFKAVSDDEGPFEDASDDEHASTTLQGPLRDEPEVIDLLSSDEDDGEDDNAGRDPSESGKNAAATLSKAHSKLAEEEESDFETESNIENSEDEVMEDKYADELPKASHVIQFDEDAKPVTTEEREGLISEPSSEEDEAEDADGIEKPTNILGIPSGGADTTESFEDIRLGTRKQTSTAQSQLTSYGGHDGTSDSLDHISLASRASEEEGTTINVNGDEVLVSGEVAYPDLPIVEADPLLHQEKSTQHEDDSVMSKRYQLPTPDATQLSAVIAPDMSFGSISSVQPSLGRMNSTIDVVGNMQDSLQQGRVEGVENISIQPSVTGPSTAATGDPAGDSFVEVVTDADQESSGDVTTAEARYADGKATTDLPTDTTQELIPEKVPNATSNVATKTAKNGMMEAIEPPPVTPRRSKRLSFNSQQRRGRVERSSSINMDEPTTPDDYDASVELAMAALDSPSKQNVDEQEISEKKLRVLLSRPLRTNLGEFTTLKLIRFNLEKKLDVIAIVTTLAPEPQRAKAGLRHYHLRFNVTDATLAPSAVVSVNIFRPFKIALPTVHPGEVVLLRNFLVKSEKGPGFTLRSDEGSSWVVFKQKGEEEVKGPPVEYGDEERDHVAYLKAWGRNLDNTS